MMNFVAFQPCRPRRDDEKRGGEGREEMDFGERILACSPRLGQFRGRLERKIVEKFDYERIYSVSFLILIISGRKDVVRSSVCFERSWKSG